MSLESIQALDYIIMALSVRYAYKLSPGGMGLCFDMLDEYTHSLL